MDFEKNIKVGGGDHKSGAAEERVPDSLAGLINEGYIRLGPERQEYVQFGRLNRKNHEQVFKAMGYREEEEQKKEIIKIKKDTSIYVEIVGGHEADKMLKKAKESRAAYAVCRGIQKYYVPVNKKDHTRVCRAITYTDYKRIDIFGERVTPDIFEKDPWVEVPDRLSGFMQFEQAYKTPEEAAEYVRQGRIMIKTRLNQIRLLKQDEQYFFTNYMPKVYRKVFPVIAQIKNSEIKKDIPIIPLKTPNKKLEAEAEKENVPDSLDGLVEKGYVRAWPQQEEKVQYGKLNRKNHDQIFKAMGYREKADWERKEILEIKRDRWLYTQDVSHMELDKALAFAEKDKRTFAVYHGIDKSYVAKKNINGLEGVVCTIRYTDYDRIYIFGERVTPKIFKKDPNVKIPDRFGGFMQFEQVYETPEEAAEYVRQGRIMVKTRLNHIRLLKQDEQYYLINHNHVECEKAVPVILKVKDPVIRSAGNIVPFRMPVRRAVNDVRD